MTRIKLFLFGIVTAFIGLFYPSKVLDLINAYDELEELRAFKKMVEARLTKTDEM